MRTQLSRPRALPMVMATAALLVAPSSVVGATTSPWLPAVRIAVDIGAQGAAGRGPTMVVVDRSARGVGVAISTDAGGTFRRRLVVGSSTDLVAPPQVATCRGDALVLTQERTPNGVHQLRLARVPGHGGSITRVTIRRAGSPAGSADLACGPDRTVVAWTERAGATWTAMAREVALPELTLARIRVLGEADRLGVAVAVSSDAIITAVARPIGTLISRIPLAAAAGAPVDAARGTLLAGVRRPVLAADGRSVAFGGRVDGLTWIQTSADGGRSFTRGTPFTAGTLGSLAVRARWVAAVLATPLGATGGHVYRRAYSDDRGTSWKLATLGLGPVAEPRMAFVTAPGGVRLTETWTTGAVNAVRHDVLFHRHA